MLMDRFARKTASKEEIDLLKRVCKDLKDEACVQAAKDRLGQQ